MIDKSQPNSHNHHSLSNTLIDDNYYNLVHDKITKELICCNSEILEIQPNEKIIEEINSNGNSKILIAKSKGLLGIHFCENSGNLPIKLFDDVILKVDDEFEFATIIETGKIVDFKLSKIETSEMKLPVIDRVVNEKDIERNISNVINCSEARKIFLKYVHELSLDMKLVDIHFQFDRKKLFFFYTSDGRVDFRELAKKLAATFKTRIELRQMGVRDEAKRIGGLATCGREFCCTTFITNFKRITTDIAEENNVANSISKYTGPCGKLKCCLSFELE
ncbi:MAG: stage 0 sporulation protein [Ignavibacteriae bacterium]|nr:stage 0 sporulation protein [Ignavibacteriota bacterium]